MAGSYIEIDGENMTIDRDGALGEGHITKSLGSGGTVTLSDAEQAGKLIEFTGTLTGAATVNFAAKDGAIYILHNNTSGDFSTTVKVTGQTGFVVDQGERVIVVCDGTDLRLAFTCPRSLSMGLASDYVSVAMSDANTNLTYTQSRAGFLILSGTLAAQRNVVLKDTTTRYLVVYNNGTGQTVNVKTSGGTGALVANGRMVVVYCDGTNVIPVGAWDLAQFAAGTALTNTTSETVLGSFTIPANTINAGTVIRIRYQGIATATNSTDTLTVRLRFGTTTLTGTALITTSAVDVANNDIFTGYFELTGRAAAAAAAAIIGSGHFSQPGAAGGALLTAYLGSTNFATNGALLVEVTGQWSVASGSNSCRLDQLNVEVR